MRKDQLVETCSNVIRDLEGFLVQFTKLGDNSNGDEESLPLNVHSPSPQERTVPAEMAGPKNQSVEYFTIRIEELMG